MILPRNRTNKMCMKWKEVIFKKLFHVIVETRWIKNLCVCVCARVCVLGRLEWM